MTLLRWQALRRYADAVPSTSENGSTSGFNKLNTQSVKLLFKAIFLPSDMSPKRSLLDLPDDALLSVAGHLHKLQHRLQLSQACRRLYHLGTGPSPLWRVVDFRSSKKRLSRFPREERLEAALEIAAGFSRWAASWAACYCPAGHTACTVVQACALSASARASAATCNQSCTNPFA